jgi:hypothetical protein
MNDGWARHEVERLLNEDEFRHAASDAFLFFKSRWVEPQRLEWWGVDGETIMSLLVRECKRIRGAQNIFTHKRQKLVDDAVANFPHAENIRVLFENMRTAMLETRETGVKDRTGPSTKVIGGIEGARDFLQAYPGKTEAFMALYDLTIKEIERIEIMQRESIGRFAWEMYRLVGQSHDKHVAALIGPVVGWPHLKAETVRNCLRAFQKKPRHI